MTTKYRIIAGFLVMVAIVATLAAVGLHGMSRSTDNFTEYDRLAKLNVQLSDMYRAVYAAAYCIEVFMQTDDEAMLDEAQQHLDGALAFGAVAETLITSPERQTMMQSALEDLRTYKESVEVVRQSVAKGLALYDGLFSDTVAALRSELATITENGKERANIQALYIVNLMWQDMSNMESSIARYIEVMTPEQGDTAEAMLRAASTRLPDLDAIMLSELARRDFVKIKNAFDALNTTFASLRQAFSEAIAAKAEMAETDLRIANLVDELSTTINTLTAETSASTYASSNASQNFMMGISAAGMILGLAMAAFIIISLVRVLGRLSEYAEAIARGNFTHNAGIREKGEIGGMVAAMRKIPDILQDVVTRCGVIANDVASGKLRAGLATGGLEGGFKELADAVNTVGASYAGVIDKLPVSIMTADTKRVLQYCNATANALVSGDMAGTFCGGKGLCGNEADCMGARCLRSGATEPGEMTVNAPEGRKDYAVAASPLADLAGNAAGFMEIITDISVIKAQEEQMRHVAAEATVISDRVAAAAEQLAAQVEEISRGAEMQRERVETTASAMTQMNSTVLEVARNASQASDQSDGTRKNAFTGAELVGKVVESINDVNEAGGKLQHNMEELGRQAENIGGVMGVISDIADQTNLLALNAAIEAARAGEAGRGFAVVADEVRKLAEKTMTATHEVGNSITAVQHSAQVNMHEVEEAVRSVGKATELANSSGSALQEIVDLASATSNVVSSIAAAAEEQSAASEQITGAIEEINKVVGETTEGMLQSSEAVQELSRMAQELRSVMEDLR